MAQSHQTTRYQHEHVCSIDRGLTSVSPSAKDGPTSHVNSLAQRSCDDVTTEKQTQLHSLADPRPLSWLGAVYPWHRLLATVPRSSGLFARTWLHLKGLMLPGHSCHIFRLFGSWSLTLSNTGKWKKLPESKTWVLFPYGSGKQNSTIERKYMKSYLTLEVASKARKWAKLNFNLHV